MKTAISIPDDVFEAAEAAARRTGMSRSHLFVEAVRLFLKLHGAKGVTERLNEVYRDTVFDRAVPPAATRSPVFLSSNSLTKAYGLSALRCGWTLARPEITARIRRARDIVDVSGPIPAERLAVVAFHHLDRLAERARRILQPNRSLLRELLVRREELECAPFDATIAFPRFRDGRDAADFVRRLAEQYGVAVVAGSFFGLPSHFRISLGASPEAVAQGLDALERCLNEIQGAS